MDKLLATCGFSIETSSEDVIKQNAAETGVTDLDWDKVNEDMQIVESAMLKWLDTMFGSARDEGHGSDDSLIGTLFIYRNLDIVKDSLDIGEPLRTGSGTLQLPEMSLTYPELIDISVDFFDLVEEKVDASKKVKSAETYEYRIPFSFTGRVSSSNYTQHTDSHLKGNLGSSYRGDIINFSIYVSRSSDEDGYHDVSGNAVYVCSFSSPLTEDDVFNYITEIIDEARQGNWYVVEDFTVDKISESALNDVEVSEEDSFDVESMRRNASAWSKEQADEVAELDAEFDAFLASEGIDPNSKEASDAWKEGYQDRMKKIFASKSVTSAKEMGVEVIVDDDQEPNDRFIEVTDMLQARYDSMKSENPDLDTADFDAELGTVALEIADEIGARLSVKDGRYIFDFTTEPAPLVKLPEPSEDSFKDEDFEDVF